MKIEKGRRVRIKIVLKVVDGDELERSVVEYFQGGGTMIAGLEKALEGLEAGAKKSGVIPAKEAFGDPERMATKVISRKEFPEDAEFEVGSQFVAKGADSNQDVVLKVIEIDDDELTVRLMHPLADKDIEFEAEILSVTDPTPPPLPVQALAADDESE